MKSVGEAIIGNSPIFSDTGSRLECLGITAGEPLEHGRSDVALRDASNRLRIEIGGFCTITDNHDAFAAGFLNLGFSWAAADDEAE